MQLGRRTWAQVTVARIRCLAACDKLSSHIFAYLQQECHSHPATSSFPEKLPMASSSNFIVSLIKQGKTKRLLNLYFPRDDGPAAGLLVSHLQADELSLA